MTRREKEVATCTDGCLGGSLWPLITMARAFFPANETGGLGHKGAWKF
jgi:hypothetical protein